MIAIDLSVILQKIFNSLCVGFGAAIGTYFANRALIRYFEKLKTSKVEPQ